MKVRVIELYVVGERRPRAQLQAIQGETGELELDAWDNQTPDRRLQLRARLTVAAGNTRRDALPPIYDVAVLRITRKGMLLQGVQRITYARTVVGFVQQWWCEPAAEQQPSKEPAHQVTRPNGVKIT